MIELFLEYAYDSNLCMPVIEKYQELLNMIIRHHAIPEDDTILGRCYLLFSHLLHPLSAFLKNAVFDPLDPENDTSEEQIEFCEHIPKILENIMDSMLGGALFKDQSNAITNEFILVVESNSDRFINKMGLLSKYIKLLEIDVSDLFRFFT